MFTEEGIGEDDITRLVHIFNEGLHNPIFAGFDEESESMPSREELQKVAKMFKLATSALKVKRYDFTA